MEKRRKEVSKVIGGLGMPALKYADYLKELVIKIVREHPEVKLEDIYVSKDDDGHMCLFYNRYMTDEEFEQMNTRLNELQEEVVNSGLLDDK